LVTYDFLGSVLFDLKCGFALFLRMVPFFGLGYCNVIRIGAFDITAPLLVAQTWDVAFAVLFFLHLAWKGIEVGTRPLI